MGNIFTTTQDDGWADWKEMNYGRRCKAGKVLCQNRDIDYVRLYGRIPGEENESRWTVIVVLKRVIITCLICTADKVRHEKGGNKTERRWTTVNVVRQVTDAETDDNDDHGSDDVQLTRMFLLYTCSVTCRLGTAAGWCWRCRDYIDDADTVLATNDADDAVVGLREGEERDDVWMVWITLT